MTARTFGVVLIQSQINTKYFVSYHPKQINLQTKILMSTSQSTIFADDRKKIEQFYSLKKYFLTINLFKLTFINKCFLWNFSSTDHFYVFFSRNSLRWLKADKLNEEWKNPHIRILVKRAKVRMIE